MKFLRNHWSHFGQNKFGNLHFEAREGDVTIILAQKFREKRGGDINATGSRSGPMPNLHVR